MSDHLVDVVGELESTEQHVWMGQPVQGCIEEILRRKKISETGDVQSICFGSEMNNLKCLWI